MTLIAGAAAVWATRAIAQSATNAATAEAIALGAGVCVLAAWCALWPPVLAARFAPDHLGNAGLAAMVTRLFVTLGLALWLARSMGAARPAFMNTLVVSYLVLLAAETGLIIRLVRMSWRPPNKTHSA